MYNALTCSIISSLGWWRPLRNDECQMWFGHWKSRVRFWLLSSTPSKRSEKNLLYYGSYPEVWLDFSYRHARLEEFLFVCLINQIAFFFLSRKTQMEFQYIYVVIIFRQQEIHFPYVMWITLKDIGKTEIHLGNKDPWRPENFQLQCLGTVLFSKFISRHYIVTWYFSNISFLLSSLFLFSFYFRWRLLRLTLYLWTNQKRKMEFFYNNPGFLELILSPSEF